MVPRCTPTRPLGGPRCLWIAALAVVLGFVASANGQLTSDVKVKTIYGELLGTTTGSANIFRGVPYARPPVASLRFQPPEPPVPWRSTVIRNAKVDPPGCPQPNCTASLPATACPASLSEDCLYLNVFTPAAPPPKESGYPVMVWIHGGNFRHGFGGGLLYDGQKLANGSSIIIVAINYRLGALGFLTLNGGLNGNFGIMDQRAALVWVRDNIAFFGGDPQSVTLYGQSAGAMSTAVHLSSARSANLFHKAIMESEPFGIYMRSREDADALGGKFVTALGCASADMQCLQSKTVSAVLEAQHQVSSKIVDLRYLLEFFIPWTPTIDGDQVIDEPLKAFQEGNVADIPIIIGTVSEECVLFIYGASPVKPISEVEYNITMLVKFGFNAEEVHQMYPYHETGSHDARDLLSLLGTDYVFRCPTRNVTRQLVTSVSRTQPIYRYIFNHSMSFDGWGPVLIYCDHRVCHGAELPFVWDPENPASHGFDYSAAEIAMSKKLNVFWTNFAHTGNPNTPTPPSDGIWKPYNKITEDEWTGTLNMTATSFTEFNDSSYFGKRCDFWDHYGYRD